MFWLSAEFSVRYLHCAVMLLSMRMLGGMRTVCCTNRGKSAGQINPALSFFNQNGSKVLEKIGFATSPKHIVEGKTNPLVWLIADRCIGLRCPDWRPLSTH